MPASAKRWIERNVRNILFEYMIPISSRSATIILLALFGFSAVAVTQQSKAPPVPGTRIAGTVLDGITNRPVAGVSISMLQGVDRRDVVTDASGQFGFSATHGTVRLITTKAGYATLRPEGHKLPTDGVLISMTPGQQIRNLALDIWPTGSLSGTVYDSKSKPVQYAHAQLMRYTYDEDGVRVLKPAIPAHGGETNDHGEFRIADMDPGDYALQVDPPLFAERVPGEPFTPMRPATVSIKAGSETRVGDLTLPSTRGATMRIRLLNQTGQSIQNTMMKYLRWNRRNDAGISTVVPLLIIGGPERAEIPVPIGIYSVTAGWMTSVSGNSQPIGLGTAIVEVGQNTELEVTVKKGGRLSGQALLEQPKGAPRPFSGVRCEWTSDTFPLLSATNAPDGTFSIENIQPGTYRLQCSATSADAYLTSLKQGNRDVLKQGLQVLNAGDTPGFTVSFSANGGTVEGRVSDPKGKISGALVVLVPDEPLNEHLYRKTQADQNGAFTIRNVAAGSYHVFAWTELDGAAYKNDAFMKPYADQGTAIKVNPAEKKSGIDVKLLN